MGIFNSMGRNSAKAWAKGTRASCEIGMWMCDELDGVFAYLWKNDEEAARDLDYELAFEKDLFMTFSTNVDHAFHATGITGSSRMISMLREQFKGILDLLSEYAEDYDDPEVDWNDSIDTVARIGGTARRLRKGLARVLATANKMKTDGIKESSLDEMR